MAVFVAFIQTSAGESPEVESVSDDFRVRCGGGNLSGTGIGGAEKHSRNGISVKAYLQQEVPPVVSSSEKGVAVNIIGMRRPA